jgi:O-antigen ligase
VKAGLSRPSPKSFPSASLSLGGTFTYVLMLAAGVSYRADFALGPFNSLSVLDVQLILGCALGGLWFLVGNPIRLGDPTLFACLSAPALITAVSMLWTSDTTATVRALIVYIESLAAYLLVVNLLHDGSSGTVVKLFAVFVVAALATSVLMYLGVPGFRPRIESAALSEQTLQSYLERLSHPFIGASNNLASVLAFAIFPLAAGVRAKLVLARPALWMAVIALLLTLSRGVIAAVCLCALISLVWDRKPSLIAVCRITAVFFVIALTGYLLLQSIPALENNLQGRLSLRTFVARADLMLQVVDAIGQRPFIGWGGGAVPLYAPWLAGSAHNTYLENAMYFGVPLATVITICLVLLPLRMHVLFRETAPGMARLCCLGLVCQLLVFVTQTSFEGSTLKIIFYGFTGMSFVLLEADSRAGLAPRAAGVGNR